MSQQTLGSDLAAGTKKYNTPLEWVVPISEAVGGFDADVCASSDSNLATVNVRNTGGLSKPWTEYVADLVDDPSDAWIWCNHPYARGEPPEWLSRAATTPCNVVALSKAAPDTEWFWDHVLDADLLSFPNTASERGDSRIKFAGEKNGADFPNVFSVYTGGDVPDELARVLGRWGWTLDPSEVEK